MIPFSLDNLFFVLRQNGFPNKRKTKALATLLTLVGHLNTADMGDVWLTRFVVGGPGDETFSSTQPPSRNTTLHVPCTLETPVHRVGGHWAVGHCVGSVNSQGYFYCGEPSCPFSVKLVKVGRGRGCTYKSIESLVFPHHLHSEKNKGKIGTGRKCRRGGHSELH